MVRVSRAVAAALVVALFGLSRTVLADEVVITGGGLGQVNGIDLPGFQLTGSTSTFTGVLPIAGVVCCVFNAGDTVSLSMGFPLGSLAGIPNREVVDSTIYPQAFVRGNVLLTAEPFVAPPFEGTRSVTLSTTFTAEGTVAGFAHFGVDEPPLFSVPITGRGIATVTASANPSSPNYVGHSLFFAFQADPAPTPEPASLALLGSGVAGLLALRRRGGRERTPSRKRTLPPTGGSAWPPLARRASSRRLGRRMADSS